MKKQKLDTAVNAKITEIREILQTVYNALNQGQRKKIVKDEKVKSLFDLYGVTYEE